MSVDPETQEIALADSKDILTRFRVRPLKYVGREITINCKITGKVMSVSSDDCSALGLPLGDAIERRVESEGLGMWSEIIAVRQMADWLESVEEHRQAVVKIKLLSGEYTEVEYSEDGPISKKRLVKGYQVIEIVKDNLDINDAQQEVPTDAKNRHG